MRFTPLAALVSVLAVATCTPVERGAVAPPSGPAFAHVQDLDGTPDMIVDAKTLATSWVVYDQELKESFCSIEEANLAPGKYRLLRFTVVTPNIGDADIYIGDPNGTGTRTGTATAATRTGCSRTMPATATTTSATTRYTS